jgi:putative endonuclease
MSSNAVTTVSMSARQERLSKQESPNNAGTFAGYTQSRRPVVLIFSEWFEQITDAIAAERKLKGWSRAKKLAFIRGDFAKLQALAKRRS